MIKDDYIMSKPSPIRIPEEPTMQYSPRSPTCGYCSDDGELYLARSGDIRCKDCFGIAATAEELGFIPLPSTDTPWPLPRPAAVRPMTNLRKWIHRRFLKTAK